MNTLQLTQAPEQREDFALGSVRIGQRRAFDTMRAKAPLFGIDGLETAVDASARSFIYLFKLSHGSAFTMGVCHHPLRRLHDLATRFHERFDLLASMLLSVDVGKRARETEASLKRELAAAVTAAPAWLPPAAGNHDTWYDSVHFIDAQQRLTNVHGAAPHSWVSAVEFAGRNLFEHGSRVEAWAFDVAKQLNSHIAYAPGNVQLELASALRDCLDLYRALQVPLFARQPEQGNFVWQMLRLYRPALVAKNLGILRSD
jgi:hypothetical protein